MKVQGKVIVVTGGGSGIGRELALNLLSKGASVAAVDIDESALRETQELAGDRNGNLSQLVIRNIKDPVVEVATTDSFCGNPELACRTGDFTDPAEEDDRANNTDTEHDDDHAHDRLRLFFRGLLE